MKEYQLQQTILVVEVPEDSYDFSINGENYLCLSSKTGRIKMNKFPVTELPDGNWQILGKALDLTEEDAKKIVESNTILSTKYKDYLHDENDSWVDCTKLTALESWHSFLKANNITENKLVLIKE